MSGIDLAKRAAAEAAAQLVESGMVVGIGSGSTVRWLIEALGRRVREQGLRIVGVPTSAETDALALHHGITLAEPDGTPIDLAIDGADEVERGTLRLIKGLGGALLREKIIAQAARRFVVIADARKVVDDAGRARAGAGGGGAVRPRRDRPPAGRSRRAAGAAPGAGRNRVRHRRRQRDL